MFFDVNNDAAAITVALDLLGNSGGVTRTGYFKDFELIKCDDADEVALYKAKFDKIKLVRDLWEDYIWYGGTKVYLYPKEDYPGKENLWDAADAAVDKATLAINALKKITDINNYNYSAVVAAIEALTAEGGGEVTPEVTPDVTPDVTPPETSKLKKFLSPGAIIGAVVLAIILTPLLGFIGLIVGVAGGWFGGKWAWEKYVVPKLNK